MYIYIYTHTQCSIPLKISFCVPLTLSIRVNLTQTLFIYIALRNKGCSVSMDLSRHLCHSPFFDYAFTPVVFSDTEMSMLHKGFTFHTEHLHITFCLGYNGTYV